MPTLKPAVVQAAVRVLPAPVSVTAPHPEIVAPPSVKVTAPVGALPVTEAVSVTLLPAIAGFGELASVVVEVVVDPPGVVTLSVRCAESADNTWIVMP